MPNHHRCHCPPGELKSSRNEFIIIGAARECPAIKKHSPGLDTLCRHNFGHNAIVEASSITPA